MSKRVHIFVKPSVLQNIDQMQSSDDPFLGVDFERILRNFGFSSRFVRYDYLNFNLSLGSGQ